MVGAVGFQHRRLPIPENTDPSIANIIQACWRTYVSCFQGTVTILIVLTLVQFQVYNSVIFVAKSLPDVS